MTHLNACLRATAARYPEQEAIVHAGQRLHWAEVDAAVDRLAAGLLALGVERGETLGILCPTQPAYILIYLAAMRVGATLAGFNVHYTAREVREYAAKVQPALFFVSAEMEVAQQLAPTLAGIPSLRQAIAIGEPAPPGWLQLDNLLATPLTAAARGQITAREMQAQPEDGALIVFTGGITGTPKAALLTHRNIVSNIAAQNHHLGWQAEDRLLLHLPMNHVSGATLLTAGAVLSGATLVMQARFHPLHALDLIATERITILGQVPAMWIMQFLSPDFGRYDLSSLRMTLVSGAPTPAETMQRMAALAPIAHHAWGLTEAAGMVTYTAAGDGLDVLLRSAGRAGDAFSVGIRGAAGHWLRPGEVGEVVVRGACVMAGYVGEPEETAHQIDAAGWLRTGDLGSLDANGYLTLTGLCKRMYISGGYNVYPLEIETYLLRHPKVAAARCEAAPHSILGETGSVYITPKPGHTLTAAEIKHYCQQGLARYKNPTQIHVMGV